ncbi:MAG: integrase core domain-containing protein [Thermoleophilia bacterium]
MAFNTLDALDRLQGDFGLELLAEFFDDYNNQRPHSSLGGKTSAQIYFGALALRQAA